MRNECWGVILAAGQGRRMAEATGGEAKQFLPYKGAPLWWRSARSMAASPLLHGLVLVFPANRLEEARAEALALDGKDSCGVPLLFAEGGERRQDSVRHALAVLPDACEKVLIHDGARPFLRTALVTRLAAALNDAVSGVIPGLAVTDTIKETDASGLVMRTPVRERLSAVQTPQAFRLAGLRAAHERAQKEDWSVTDDASLMERCGLPVLVIEGDDDNIKITTPQDLALLSEQKPSLPCCGYGYDVHAYGGDRPLMLGGVSVGGDFLIRAHSDGDVLLHALMDAVRGAAALGEIGQHFPDSDPDYMGASSLVLLGRVMDLLAREGWRLENADLTSLAQRPKLKDHIPQMRQNLARAMGVPLTAVSVKATTEEGLGFTGMEQGIAAHGVVLLEAMAPGA